MFSFQNLCAPGGRGGVSVQAPSLDPAVLNHLPSDSTFCSASETLLEGRERLERKAQADL